MSMSYDLRKYLPPPARVYTHTVWTVEGGVDYSSYPGTKYLIHEEFPSEREALAELSRYRKDIDFWGAVNRRGPSDTPYSS